MNLHSRPFEAIRAEMCRDGFDVELSLPISSWIAKAALDARERNSGLRWKPLSRREVQQLGDLANQLRQEAWVKEYGVPWDFEVEAEVPPELAGEIAGKECKSGVFLRFLMFLKSSRLLSMKARDALRAELLDVEEQYKEEALVSEPDAKRAADRAYVEIVVRCAWEFLPAMFKRLALATGLGFIPRLIRWFREINA